MLLFEAVDICSVVTIHIVEYMSVKIILFIISQGALKRPRSPSPPNAAGYHQYAYKPSVAQAAYQSLYDLYH